MFDGYAVTEDLDVEVETYVEATSGAPPSPLERWSFVVGLLAAGLGMLIATLVGGMTGLNIIRLSLIIELLGLGLSVGLQVKRNWQQFRRSRRTYARELDADYREYLRFVDWLRGFPHGELLRKLHYLRDRKASLSYRLGLLTGGVERLGLLPVLAALYIQFKDWEFGNWQALADVHAVGGLLLWALFLMYLGGWYLLRLKTRLDVYESLLAEATRVEPA